MMPIIRMMYITGVKPSLIEASVLVALYLRGLAPASGVIRRRWPAVLLSVQSRPDSSPLASLRAAGYWQEATILETPGLLARAEALVLAGRALVPGLAGYPRAWLKVLGPAAPPALWAAGAAGPWMRPIPLCGAVGRRDLSPKSRALAGRVASQATVEGFGLISGAAVGADSHSAEAAWSKGGSVFEVLPRGLGPEDHAFMEGRLGLRLSMCAPGEPFSASAAMERNALIYAGSELTVVISARLREGGTWHGALHALRRRLCPVLAGEPESAAGRALLALGAVPLRPGPLAPQGAQADQGLFGIFGEGIAEAQAGWPACA